MADVFCVPPDRAAEYFDPVENLIRKALIRGLTDFEAVKQDVIHGRALLWMAWDGTRVYAAAVTQIAIANGRKFCTIVACGGEQVIKWQHLIEKIEEYAKGEGCSSMAIFGRKGWARKYPDYKITAITLEKAL